MIQEVSNRRIESDRFSGQSDDDGIHFVIQTGKKVSTVPSKNSHVRPHTQVRHSLPSVVRKQGLLQF